MATQPRVTPQVLLATPACSFQVCPNLVGSTSFIFLLCIILPTTWRYSCSSYVDIGYQIYFFQLPLNQLWKFCMLPILLCASKRSICHTTFLATKSYVNYHQNFHTGQKRQYECLVEFMTCASAQGKCCSMHYDFISRLYSSVAVAARSVKQPLRTSVKHVSNSFH